MFVSDQNKKTEMLKEDLSCRTFKKNSISASLSRNHDPVDPQTLVSAASCRSCFYSVSPCRRKCSPSFLERDVVPSTLIKFERRQTSLQPISPKLVNSHQNNLGCLIALQVRGEICSLRFDFGVNCTFKFDCRHPVFPAVTANMLSASSSVSNHKRGLQRSQIITLKMCK